MENLTDLKPKQPIRIGSKLTTERQSDRESNKCHNT